jgi:integrase
MRKSKGRIFARNGIRWIAYYKDGKEYRESSPSSDGPVAQDLLDKRLREVANDAEGIATFTEPQSRRLKISDLVASLREHYKLEGRLTGSTESELKRVEGIKDEDDVIRFGDIRALALTAKHVADYKRDRLAKGHAQASINRTLTFLSRCYSLAIENEVLKASDKPPIKMFPVGNKNARQGFFEDADFRKVYAELADNLKDYALFAFLTAWRKGEVSCLKWKYLQNGVLRIPAEETKNNVARSVVIAGELTEIIGRRETARLWNGVLTDYIFHRSGRRITEFRKAWASACRKAGFADRIFHDLRRSGVRNMIRSGTPQNVAMKISGHETVSMFKRYDICNDDDLRAAAENVQRYNAARSANAASQNVVVMK